VNVVGPLMVPPVKVLDGSPRYVVADIVVAVQPAVNVVGPLIVPPLKLLDGIP
jgi:hypothetical protein